MHGFPQDISIFSSICSTVCLATDDLKPGLSVYSLNKDFSVYIVTPYFVKYRSIFHKLRLTVSEKTELKLSLRYSLDSLKLRSKVSNAISVCTLTF